jgi:hypothetical protein
MGDKVGPREAIDGGYVGGYGDFCGDVLGEGMFCIGRNVGELVGEDGDEGGAVGDCCEMIDGVVGPLGMGIVAEHGRFYAADDKGETLWTGYEGGDGVLEMGTEEGDGLADELDDGMGLWSFCEDGRGGDVGWEGGAGVNTLCTWEICTCDKDPSVVAARFAAVV